MNLDEAARQGILRVRKDVWAFADAYLRQDLLPNGGRGPWVHLFSRQEQEIIGEPTPQSILVPSEFGRRILDPRDDDYVPYTGPLDEADTWRS